MSGGNSKNKGRSRKHQGWEEAGGEFYQELYPGGEQELFDLQKTDAMRLATLLPSKQARNTATVKRVRSQNERRQSTFARTTQSHDVNLSMLPDLSENLSNEERTWEEIMQIKAMPVPMAQKKELKDRLQNATKLRLQGFEQLHWRQRKVWHRFCIRLNEVFNKLELWKSSMRQIEGKSGTGVVAYFLFLRWLVFLNVVISTVIVIFLILPKVILVDRVYECSDPEQNLTVCCARAYLDKNLTDNVILDVIQGTGWMERTIMFYGFYSNQILEYRLYFLDSQMYYNMPLAYVLVPIFWALLSLVAIVKSAAKGFKERLLESEGHFYMYCNLVFGGWDFCIQNEKSAKVKYKAIYSELKWRLLEERMKEERKLVTSEMQLLLQLKRLLINVLVLTILILSGILIYVTFNYSVDRLKIDDLNEVDSTLYGENSTERSRAEKYAFSLFKNGAISFQQLENMLLEFLPFVCIALLNLFVPDIFGYLIKTEDYTPSRVIIVTLLRTVSLRLSSLAVLLSQIYIHVATPGRLVCALNNDDGTKMECWETYVGQQLYKLVFAEFTIQFATTFFINLPRAFVARHSKSKCLKFFGEQDFYLPKHVLDIVYIQTVIWMGAFFCPMLPMIGIIFYFLLFYIKKFTCLIVCTPSPTVYRASKSKSLFMSVLLLGFVVSILPVAYSVAEILPSVNCGPYRGYRTVWQYAIQTFEKFPHLLREFIFFLGTSTFAVPAIAVLLFFLYYYWAVATANRHMVVVLKNQLVLEGHDKQFLLERLSAFIRQHQRRCDRKSRASLADEEVSTRHSSK